MVASRTFNIDFGDEEEVTCLMPFADIMNHKFPPNADLYFNTIKNQLMI